MNVMPPSSGWKSKPSMEQGTKLADVDFHCTTRSYSPEDGPVHTHPRENLKFRIILLVDFEIFIAVTEELTASGM
jgi:hypothetical protein